MQQLTCSVCDETWERPPKRGRPPKVCPVCRGDEVRIVEPLPPPTKPKATKRKPRKRKSKWQELDSGLQGDLAALPLSERASGWCTDYDPAPKAQHDKCDGDLGKTRCKCPSDCHEWN
jgi:hypothetical protein